MEISRENGVVHLSQKRYIRKVLERFNMHMSKPVSTLLASHFKLSELQMPQSMDEVEHMSKVPYTSAVGSIMYAMILTMQGILIEGGPQLDTSLLSLAVPLVENRLYSRLSFVYYRGRIYGSNGGSERSYLVERFGGRIDFTKGAIKVEKVMTDDTATDMLTKIVPLAKFAHCKDLARVCIN
uniref:Reverse transcriptase Ty1/copia-type domain-containing protein n=1 Tax=Solanum lycopersicum TaxID=4081 RepID=A0A3Q7J586_SOLLC